MDRDKIKSEVRRIVSEFVSEQKYIVTGSVSENSGVLTMTIQSQSHWAEAYLDLQEEFETIDDLEDVVLSRLWPAMEDLHFMVEAN